jgi:SAM-dependent methyltransferase
MAPAQRYDTIGLGYTAFRQPDPHIADQIWAAVGAAERIVNVGAGTGSYERADRHIVSVEPSSVMIEQRGASAPPVVQAGAEHLPFPDRSFQVALALLTVHHWNNLAQGLAELKRVSQRQIVFTFDQAAHDRLWLFRDYVPAAVGLDHQAPLASVVELLGATRVAVIPVPADCTDGFGSAYWRRPERYLDPAVRASISVLARLHPSEVDPGLRQLERDLADGSWHERHADLLARETLDCGLRLVIAE